MEYKGELYEGSKIMHKERVRQNDSRRLYVIEQFRKNDIKYKLKNEDTCHFHAWRKSDNKLFQFWGGTGKIMGCSERGIQNLIKILIE